MSELSRIPSGIRPTPPRCTSHRRTLRAADGFSAAITWTIVILRVYKTRRAFSHADARTPARFLGIQRSPRAAFEEGAAKIASATFARAPQSNSERPKQEEAVDDRWAIEKRRELWRVIAYSIVGLIIVTALVTLVSYAIYANSNKVSDVPAAMLIRF
jgi:3-mercaptopyruvate sulfurtransferase SseA